jgi:hypothetical protein
MTEVDNEEDFYSATEINPEIENDNEEYEIDPEYEEYLQNSFQDDIIEDIFFKIKEYINHTALPICEFLTREGVEIIIQNLAE